MPLWTHCDVSEASWQGDISAKYKGHATELEKYIDNDRSDTRWIFYTAQSYHDSAAGSDKEENQERLRRSIKYYKERDGRPDGYKEERFYAQFRIGTIMINMEEPFHLTLMELLKAYNIDPIRGESFKAIIDYYMRFGEWHNAYLYSKFAYETYHNVNPYPQRILFIDQALYEWKFAEMHAATCFYTGRKDEAKIAYIEVQKAMKKNPEFFTQPDIDKIKTNERFFV